ncbi:MerR family transcriptional regulator [Nonomuraea aurantiaca]|uniref:MerR family transcriptional regulator n=1 Tax=Nonomuraea aurantiaca TaxID=2878562 RepID=UPI001CD98C6C|nr:MerR family transcriptional regulator [Nonomuraea aurantiaca]MCA2228731.1 MerR family transcriptional regulator [Nonomuraea aurantiaca]
MPETATELSIGQVAARTGLSIHALRFYEREGLLANPVRRDPAGRRVYTEQDVQWLNLCVILRTTGMPLPEIRKYADLVRQGAGHDERLAVLRRHQEHVMDQLSALTDSLNVISLKVRAYEDSSEENPVEHECRSPFVTEHPEQG